jgi:hypothetical protein
VAHHSDGTDVYNSHHNPFTLLGLAALAILLEGLQDELWYGSAGEFLKTNDLHVGKLAQGAEKSHRLSRARRTTEPQELVL